MVQLAQRIIFFFFTATATPEIYTLSLHDALPICGAAALLITAALILAQPDFQAIISGEQDRKSTRLNSSHVEISYAVFCLKKKKTKEEQPLGGQTTQYQTSADIMWRTIAHRHRPT